jgi:hypothetical protein
VSALSFGDAVVVAVAGGIGTLIGGTITAIVAYKTKLIEARANAALDLAGAQRRQGERQAEVSQQLLSSLTDLQETVLQVHMDRLDGSRVNFPKTKALLEFRAKAVSTLLLAARVVAPQLRQHVHQTIQECQELLTELTLKGINDKQARLEKSLEDLSAEAAQALINFEAQAVQP